ncbi:M48 family metallopeptidase [bacterium]|nr:M48 family metallopeptidase [bacterium]
MGIAVHTITYGQQSINFTVRFSHREKLTISVHPDLSVIVDAPDDKQIAEVVARVKRRAGWIVRQRDFFERFKPEQPERRYVGGETHIYLGRQYRLKLIEDKLEYVKLTRGYFLIQTRNPHDSTKVKSLLDKWYADHSRRVIRTRIDRCFESLQRYGVNYPTSITFRRMSKRWGSCNKAGGVMLNTELAKASVFCIDYVITHEMCHLKYTNHSKDFYRLLDLVMPDWKRRKSKLEIL